MSLPHWSRDAFFYHIYPLGFCGAPDRNDFRTPPTPRLEQLYGWLDHLQELGATALYLGPLFESSSHGYDTADYYHVDCRLGSDETLARLVSALHGRGMRVILDGVFNHVGRDFWAFRDLLQNREDSAYRDWFQGLAFGRRSPYNDPFSYEGWNGHYDLVKLNLRNLAVKDHLLHAVETWIERFGIDGLRLDAADVVDLDFQRELASFCRTRRADFWLMGEIVHGDYRRWANPQTLDAVTNYECYKGLYSSLNDKNYFEIAYALNRQFGPNGLYRGLPLYAFADNHDVNRVASSLRNPAHLYPLYALLLTMPGVPSVYYGSEWGIEGKKRSGDDRPLRPQLDLAHTAQHSPNRDLARAIARLAHIRHSCPALRHGDYHELHISAQQFAFIRQTPEQSIVVALNASDQPVALEFGLTPLQGMRLIDLLNDQQVFLMHGSQLHLDAVPPCWAHILLLQ